MLRTGFLFTSSKGASAVEYAVLLSVMAMVAFTVASTAEDGIRNAEDQIAGLFRPADDVVSSPPSVEPSGSCIVYTEGDDHVVASGEDACHNLLSGTDRFDASSSAVDLRVLSGLGLNNGWIRTGDGNDTIISRQGGRVSTGAGNDEISLILAHYGEATIDMGAGDDSLVLRQAPGGASGLSTSIDPGSGNNTVDADCHGREIELRPSSSSTLEFSGDCSISIKKSNLNIASLSLKDISGLSGRIHNSSNIDLLVDGVFATQEEHAFVLSKVDGLTGSVRLRSDNAMSLSLDNVSTPVAATFSVDLASRGGLLAIDGNSYSQWSFIVDHGPEQGSISFDVRGNTEHFKFPTIQGRTHELVLRGCYDAVSLIQKDGSELILDPCPRPHDLETDPANAIALVAVLNGQRTSLNLQDLELDTLRQSKN